MTDNAAILAEIVAMVSAGERKSLPTPNFSADEFAMQFGCSHDMALKRLKGLVKAGVLDCAHVVDAGHKCFIFWKK